MNALGLRIKSGFAIGIVASGDARAWTVVSRHDVPLTNGTGEYARFPFHPTLELNDERAAHEASKRAIDAIEATARKEIAALLKSVARLDAAALVVGSLIDPAKIGNTHMRAHASEGQLYREIVGRELDRHDLARDTLVERDAYAFVSQRLKCIEVDLRADIDVHGKKMVKPWRADEKLAALAAYWRLREH